MRNESFYYTCNTIGTTQVYKIQVRSGVYVEKLLFKKKKRETKNKRTRKKCVAHDVIIALVAVVQEYVRALSSVAVVQVVQMSAEPVPSLNLPASQLAMRLVVDEVQVIASSTPCT